MRSYVKRYCVLAAAVMLMISGCGRADNSDYSAEGEWGYLPEFIVLDEEGFSYDDMQLSGDNIYFLSQDTENREGMSGPSINRYSLTDRNLTKIFLDWQAEPDGSAGQITDRQIRRFAVAEDGSLYFITQEEVSGSDSDDVYVFRSCLYKFDEKGERIFARDITAWLDGGYSFYMLTGPQGELYIGSGTSVWRLDGAGDIQDCISVGDSASRIAGIGYDREGKVYAAYQSFESSGEFGVLMVVDGDMADYMLAELDFDTRKAVDACEKFSYDAAGFFPGVEGDFLVFDKGAVYEYDLETETAGRLFGWIDCDVNGRYAKVLGVLEDGRIAAVYGDGIWGDDSAGIVLLTKAWIDPKKAKETLVLAAMSADNSLQAAVVEFNRNNTRYRVEIRQYYDMHSGETWEEALVNLNNAIASDNCPDIIDLKGLDVESFAAKGIFEDLSSSLERSSVLDREDVLESILDAYTFDGKLVAIPRRFLLQTAVGNAAELSGIQEWTIEKVIAFAEAHPDKELFDRATKDSVLDYLMRLNQETFIDWSTGECFFDSDRLKNMLRFVNRFPDTVDWNVGTASEPTRLGNGELLLSREYMSSIARF